MSASTGPGKQPLKDQTKQCWLCIYATHAAAHTVNALISEHIHSMSLETISNQCSLVIEEEIRRQNPCNANEVLGYAPRDIRRHITEHMLHPNVTLGLTLRRLVDMNEQLRQGVFSKDPETDQKVLDQSTLRNYLSVTSQITSIYKLGETGKLLFSRGGVPDGGSVAAAGSRSTSSAKK